MPDALIDPQPPCGVQRWRPSRRVAYALLAIGLCHVPSCDGGAPGLNEALQRACRQGRVEVVRDLLDRGASVSASDEDGNTPLHFAVATGNVELVRLLLAAGADGIFLETHPEPGKAKSDGANMLALDSVEDLLVKLVKIKKTISEF